MQALRPCLAWICVALLAGCSVVSAPEQNAKAKAKSRPEHLVEVSAAEQAAVTSAYRRNGTLTARRVARIHVQEQGRIVELPWFEGDQVKAGALLLRLDDALLRAELDKARATSRQARADLARMQNLVKRSAASKDELERSRTGLDVAEAEQRMLETRLGYMRLEAPFDAVVSERRVEPGDVVATHTHVLTLLDPASLVVELPVSELLLPHLQLDDPAEVRIDALGDRAFAGRILRIHPALDRNTRQGIVEVALAPIPAGARAGQFARVTLSTARVSRLLIPFPALQRDREGEFVYRLDGDGKARRSPVRSGLRAAERVEILEGLEAGDRIVIRGFLGLTDGKSVVPSAGPG